MGFFFLLAFFAFAFNFLLMLLHKAFPLFTFYFVAFVNILFIVSVMMWKFFNDANVMQKNRVLLFFPRLRVQILKKEYKYGQYCTLLSQSDCRYF